MKKETKLLVGVLSAITVVTVLYFVLKKKSKSSQNPNQKQLTLTPSSSSRDNKISFI